MKTRVIDQPLSFERAHPRRTLDLGFAGRRLLVPLRPLSPARLDEDFGGLSRNRTARMTTEQR